MVQSQPGDLKSPAWSPDGTHLAYVQWAEQSSDIYTINANGTGQFVGGITALGLTQGNPWTKETNSMPPEGEEITWTYANGILHLSDGTPNFDTDFVVSIGGRMATFAGLGDDGELDLIILTRTP